VHQSIIYKEPTRCNFGQYRLLTTARTLYMFRTLSAPIIRSNKNCSNSHWCMSWVGMMYIQLRCPRSAARSVVIDNRPWTSLLDIHHPDSWHAPAAVTTVFSTPDDGRRKRPKHVECTCSC